MLQQGLFCANAGTYSCSWGLPNIAWRSCLTCSTSCKCFPLCLQAFLAVANFVDSLQIFLPSCMRWHAEACMWRGRNAHSCTHVHIQTHKQTQHITFTKMLTQKCTLSATCFKATLAKQDTPAPALVRALPIPPLCLMRPTPT